jgi:hypothetical protein
METKPRRGSRTPPPAAVAVPAIAAPSPEPPQPTAEPAPLVPAARPAPAVGSDPLSALMESQAAVARGLTELGAEMAAMARGGIDAATRSAGDLLTAKTLADAIKINTLFARHSFEALIGGSARLSEIGVKLAAEASRPILSQLSRDWARAAR